MRLSGASRAAYSTTLERVVPLCPRPLTPRPLAPYLCYSFEVPKSAPPPDFRYVGLTPAPTRRAVIAVAAVAGVATAGFGVVLSAGGELATLVLATLAGAVTAWMVARWLGPTLPSLAPHAAPLAIVPWGVLVHSEPVPRMLRWAAVRSIKVDFIHEMDHATPLTRWSLVTICTDRETLGGRAPGQISLERLEAYFPRYAEEAARPAALDLDGNSALDEWLQPNFELLLAEARRLLYSGELSERLGLMPRSYREPRPGRASAEAIGLLEEVLRRPPESAADPRPLAALIAAELGASELMDPLRDLATSPHPLLAAIARASALRLGADVKRVGAVDELSDFVPPRELEQIESWALARTH